MYEFNEIVAISTEDFLSRPIFIEEVNVSIANFIENSKSIQETTLKIQLIESGNQK